MPEQHIYLPGRRRVLITAPHSEEHLRNGQPKHAEPMTGEIARFLANNYNCHALITNGPQNHDPNFDEPCPLTDALCPFKDKIAAIIKQRKIRFVLDLHQLRSDRPFLFVIGTNDGETTLGHKLLVPYLQTRLIQIAGDESLCLVNPEIGFSARHKRTITRFVADQHHVPAIQLEINSRLIDRLPDLSNQLAGFVKQLVPLNRKPLI